MPTTGTAVSRHVASAAVAVAVLLAIASCQSWPDDAFVNEPVELPTFAIQELGLLPGGNTSQAFAINEAGVAVGFATDAGGVRRAVYFQGGQAIQLPEPANTTRSDAYDINDNGVIVGSVRVSGIELPCRWDTPTSQPVLLTLLDGTDRGRARSINNAGVIAGFVTGDEWLVRWLTDGTIQDLNPTVRESYEPLQINEAGMIAGNAEDIEAAYLWSEQHGIVFLGSLEGGGDADDDDEGEEGPGESEAAGLDSEGRVVGSSEDGDGALRAFRYNSSRGMLSFGDPPAGYNGVVGRAINDAGLVAGNGVATDDGGTITASATAVTVMSELGRQFEALATLGGARAEPSDAGINQCGVIVGWAFPAGSVLRRAVAWVPPGCPVL